MDSTPSMLGEHVRGQSGNINSRKLQAQKAALFLIATFYKQSKCALKGDWLNYDGL